VSRPTGVTILAIVALTGACLFVVFGALALVGGMVAAMASVPLFAMLAGAGATGVAVFCLVAAAVSASMAIGLLKLRNGARLLTMIFVGLSLLASVFGITRSLFDLDVPSAVVRLIIGAIDVWIITYLLKAHVKQAFGTTGL
jgi:hypothetical protein